MVAFSLISFLVTRRALALLAVGVVTAVLGWSALTLGIDPGVESMIPSDPGDLARLHALRLLTFPAMLRPTAGRSE